MIASGRAPCGTSPWFQGDGYPCWSLWDNVRTWWQVRHLPNMLMLHYADMKADLPGTVRRIAAFLDIGLDDETFRKAVLHSSFDLMKAHTEQAAPLGGAVWQGGAQTFVNKGTNGRWQGMLTPEETAAYEAPPWPNWVPSARAGWPKAG